jgi:hypothetical protein
MTVLGRKLPFAGIAKAIDGVTATKGWSRPNPAIHDRRRERLLPDRKADIARGETSCTAAIGSISRFMCGARRGTISQREKVTGRAFDRQIGSTKRRDRYADCRISTRTPFDRHFCYPTGDRKWLTRESRVDAYARCAPCRAERGRVIHGRRPILVHRPEWRIQDAIGQINWSES